MNNEHIEGGNIMAKHQRKIEAALAARQANAPTGPGFKKPGSRNRKKGYRSAPKQA
jgi:hypothetical protein